MPGLTKEKTEIIIGNPGCGKTTELVSRVATLLETGVNPQQIAYCSFSVSAIEEAIARATVKCNIPRENFPWFRTLHSMAFQMLGLNTQQTMQDFHLKDFGKAINMRFTSLDRGALKNTSFLTKEDKMLQIINVSRLYDKPVREYMIDDGCDDLSVERTEKLAEMYRNYKLALGIFDYTDMLLLAKKAPLEIPDFEHLFVDEAQDLSTLQWYLVERIAEHSKQVTITGDDKQAINSFAGADVDYFLALEGTVTTLEQSYRVPKQVFNMANRIASKMSKYREEGTKWTPRLDQGYVQHVTALPIQEMRSGEWLILGRTNRQVQELANILLYETSDFMAVFTVNGTPPIDTDIFRAIDLFEIEESPAGRGKEDLILFKDDDTEEERSRKVEYVLLFKKFIDVGETTKTIQPWELTDSFLKQYKETSWIQAFNKVGINLRKYIAALLPIYRKKGLAMFADANIKFMTIHAAKGTEAQNVIVLTNIPRSVQDTIRNNANDVELKVFYVAVTRAKEKLFLLTQNERSMTYKSLM